MNAGKERKRSRRKSSRKKENFHWLLDEGGMRHPREGSEMVGDGDGVMKGRRRKVSYAAGSRKG